MTVRNVTRKPKPACLTRNARRWKKEFLQALKGDDAKLIKRRRARYNHKEVRQTLNTMYRNFCCYCESPVGPVRADQIEHRMPVDGFPGEAFEWKNLHLGCGGCNGAKSNQWDAANPILDAVIDIPLDSHLAYQTSRMGVRCISKTPRGWTTLKHADLNREPLRLARGAVFLEVLDVIKAIRDRLRIDADDMDAANREQELREKCDGEYGSMIHWAIAEWLEPYA